VPVTLWDLSPNKRFALMTRATGYDTVIPYIIDRKTGEEHLLFQSNKSDGSKPAHFYGRFAPDGKSVNVVTGCARQNDVFGVVPLLSRQDAGKECFVSSSSRQSSRHRELPDRVHPES